MPSFTVTSVEETKALPDFKHGPAKILRLGLKDSTGAEKHAELFQMQKNPDPELGSTLEGDLEDSEYGLKFKRAGRGGPGNAGGMTPAREQRIVRQHSQEQAVRVMAILGRVLDEESFRNLVSWFEDDAFGKMKSGANGWPMTSDVPADTEDLFPS